jgi:zinc protease
MRSLRKIAIATATALLPLGATMLSVGSARAQVKDYRDIKAPPLRQASVPQPKRIQLPNGMVIFLMEDHELPLVRGTAVIRGGGRDVPAEKAGLAGIYGQAWRTGGTASKTGDQLDEFLEARAANVETGADEDSAVVSLDVLKGDFDTVFPIFVDILRNPQFRQEKIDLAKTQANTGISRRNDDPRGLGDREAVKIGYGADSPYARQAEYATISSITRDDLLAFHKKYVHPNNIIFGIVGDFDTAKMEAKLKQAFASWPKGPQAPSAAPTGGTPAKPGVYYVAKDDVTQSNIYVIHGGTQRNNPDYYSLVVMNEILSGGFSGRLMNDIRTARGLAYGVGGGVGAPWDHPGIFRIWMGTKSGSTVEAIGALKTQLNDLTAKPFGADELAQAKEAILNAYVFTMDSRAKTLRQQIFLEFYGFPANYYNQYPGNIQKVTAEDVARVAKKYVHPDQIAVLVVGKEKDFDKPLSTLGTVTPIDITIPEPGAKPAAAGAAAAAPKPAGSSAEGLALARKVQEFVGGKAKIDSVQSVRMLSTISMKTPQGPMDIEADNLTRFPDMRRAVMKTPMGEMTMVSTSEGAFMSSPMGTQDMPSSQREAQVRDAKTDMVTVLKNIDNPKYIFTVSGADTLVIDADGATVKWVVDPASGKILKKIGQGPRGETTTEYSEWKVFNGLNVPVAFVVMTGAEQSASGKVTNFEVNPAVDVTLFQKPK